MAGVVATGGPNPVLGRGWKRKPCLVGRGGSLLLDRHRHGVPARRVVGPRERAVLCVVRTNTTHPFSIEVRRVETAAEARAAAALRVEEFYKYPEDKDGVGRAGNGVATPWAPSRRRQDQDREAWKRKKHKSELERGGVLSALGMKVVSLLAIVYVEEDGDEEAEAERGWGERGVDHLRLREAGGQRARAVGTLDINVGRNLPGELLVGDLPRVPTTLPEAGRAEPSSGLKGLAARFKQRSDENAAWASIGRAYIFNLCVLQEERRKGIATSLMQSGREAAGEMGVQALYVHVEEANAGARVLYDAMGYALEKEETELVATRMGRQRRLLLRNDL